MSLTNRLSMFFLSALALVLAGFAIALYFLIRMHLYAQFDERLNGAMKTLVAGVETHNRDVQWEPHERKIVVGESSAAEEPRWTLHDPSGHLIDRSKNLDHSSTADLGTSRWRVLKRQLQPTESESEGDDDEDKDMSSWVSKFAETPVAGASTISLKDHRMYKGKGLVVTVTASEAPVQAMLNRLAFALFGVTVATWTVAALWGRWLCRRALRPISEMAISARSIRAEPDRMRLLDVPATRDELEDLGQAFNELLTDLCQSLERQRRFTGDASHELRTPLTALLISVDVAMRQDRSPLEYQRVLEIVRRRGGQLQRIIESLLFLARAEGASLVGAPERFEMNEWCREWLATWNEHPRAIDFSFQPSSSTNWITSHPVLLGQVLDNLLDNACKYSSPGSGIQILVEADCSSTAVTVKDDGCGITAADQAHIFEPFYRASHTEQHGGAGTGLGLSVVHRLLEVLGAKIEVASDPGKGSCFKVVLHRDPEVRNSGTEPAVHATTVKLAG